MRKGFTLIELLAVIVILAIIALIATPIILGIINDAKEDSNKRSVENYAHAVELAVARAATKQGGVIEEGIYKIEDKGKTIISPSGERIQIDYKGEAVTEGTIEVEAKGKIKLSSLSFGGKTKYNYSEKDGVTKNESSEGGNTETSSPFKVTKDGVLIHYERQGNETSVKVPAEVNGIKIKSIAPFAFLQADLIQAAQGDSGILILITEIPKELEDMAAQNNIEVVMIDELLKRDNLEFNLEDASGGFVKSNIINVSGELNLDFAAENLSSHYLTDVDLSDMIYLEKLNHSAFRGPQVSSSFCSSSDCKGTLKSVKFPMNGVLTTIGPAAFASNYLTQIIIPESVVKIGDYAFSNNNITTITIPENVIEIGSAAFIGNNITTATIKGDSSRFDSVWSYIFESTVVKAAG